MVESSDRFIINPPSYRWAKYLVRVWRSSAQGEISRVIPSFASNVLRKDVSESFQIDTDSPYMLLVADVAGSKRFPTSEEQRKLFGIDKLNVPRSSISAVTHVGYSACIQPFIRKPIPSIIVKSKGPVLVNTSFNVRDKPIVRTLEDAFRCF